MSADIDWTVDDRPHHQATHDRFRDDMDDALAAIEDGQPEEPRVCSVCGGRGWFHRTAWHAPWVEIPTECVDCP